MSEQDKSIDVLSLTRSERVALTRKAIDEVYKELGADIAPHISRKKICDLVQKKLPTRPMYDLNTIEMIMAGTYE